MMRAATSSAVSASIAGSVASDASFQASCSSRGSGDEAGWTLTSCWIMRAVLKRNGDRVEMATPPYRPTAGEVPESLAAKLSL